MARKTAYCAQAFWRRGQRLVGGEVYRFHTEERARRGAEALLTGNAGVAVFSVDGHPDEDLWNDPVMIETIGSVPALSDDGPQDWMHHAA